MLDTFRPWSFTGSGAFLIDLSQQCTPLLRFMGTRVYASFLSPAQEAAFLGIDDYDAVQRRLETYERQLDAAFYSAEDQGMSIWEAMQLDDEVSELRDLRLNGFGRVHSPAIPDDMDPTCGGVPVDHPRAPWLLYTAGSCPAMGMLGINSGVEAYGFSHSTDVMERLRSCGCTEIYWA